MIDRQHSPQPLELPAWAVPRLEISFVASIGRFAVDGEFTLDNDFEEELRGKTFRVSAIAWRVPMLREDIVAVEVFNA